MHDSDASMTDKESADEDEVVQAVLDHKGPDPLTKAGVGTAVTASLRNDAVTAPKQRDIESNLVKMAL